MLKFDPDRWIAERMPSEGLAGLAGLAGPTLETENRVSNVQPARVAKAANVLDSNGELAGDDPKNTRDNRNDSPPSVASVPSVPSVPPLDPVRAQKRWCAALDRLDWDAPLHGLNEQRWQRLLEDACWVFNSFGEQAARAAWSERDLFGVLPGNDGWGGIADRLRASRSLMLTGDRAGWRCILTGKAEGYARGNGDWPPLTPLWEAK